MEGTIIGGLLVQLRREVERDLASRLIFLHIFRLSDHPAFHQSLFGQTYLRIHCRTALALPITDVKQDMALFRGRESVTLKGHTWCSGQFGMDAIISQIDRIITRNSDLLRMVKTRTIAHASSVVHRSGNRLQHTLRRHQHNTTHLKLMQTRESLDGLIPIIITGCLPSPFIPNMTVGGRSRFSHAKRHGSRREMEPTAMCRTYTGLNILSQRLQLHLLRASVTSEQP